MFRMWLLILFGLSLVALATTFFASEQAGSNIERIEQIAQDALARAEKLTSSQDTTSPSQADDMSSPDATSAPSTEDAVLAVIVTGGNGISLRSSCDDDARMEGGVPEGTTVVVLTDGDGPCLGWSLVSYEAPWSSDPTSTWARNDYLELLSDE